MVFDNIQKAKDSFSEDSCYKKCTGKKKKTEMYRKSSRMKGKCHQMQIWFYIKESRTSEILSTLVNK